MKLTINSKDLLRAMSTISAVIDGRAILPILSNVMVETMGEAVRFVGSDLEHCVEHTCAYLSDELGDVMIPATTLLNIAKELPEGEVEIVAEDGHCTLSIEDNVYRLQTMATEDFPIWKQGETATTIEVTQSDLKRLLDMTGWAIPLSDPRQALLGLSVETSVDKESGEVLLLATSTDGKKLAHAQIPIAEQDGELEGNIVLPHKALMAVSRGLTGEGMVTIQIGTAPENALASPECSFSYGDTVVHTKLIGGTYPNWRLVVPKDYPIGDITLDNKSISKLVRQALIVADGNSNSVRFSFEADSLTVTAQTHSVGSFERTIEIDYEGEAFEMALNGRLTLEALKHIGGQALIAKVAAPDMPVILHAEGNDRDFALVMPIKITEVGV